MEYPLVSIIVPVYNTESFLDICLTSIKEQTYHNIQIILVDDGSTDNSLEICSKHAADDNRVLLIRKQNGGVSSARNAGLNASTGTYIMFVDSDDWIERNAVELLVNIQRINEYDVIYFGYYREDKNINQISKINSSIQSYRSKDHLMALSSRMIRDGSLHQLWNKFYKACIIRKYNISFDEWLNLGEDVLFNYHVFFEINSLYITDQCLYHYTIREKSLDHGYNPMKYHMLSYVNDWLQEKIKENSAYAIIKPSADHIRFKNVFSCIFDLFRLGCTQTYKNKRKFLRILSLSESSFPYHLNNILYRILLTILRTKNIALIYISGFLIHKSRQAYKKCLIYCRSARRKRYVQ